jgi:large repetitive protein
MKHLYFKISVSLLVVVLFCGKASAQLVACPTVDAGPDVNLTCGNNCATLQATYIHAGSTTSYDVSPITYNPIAPYNTGTPIIIGIDDRWSALLPLPFPFCFFGTTYTSVVAGSNGILTFNAAAANGFCNWVLTSGVPIPTASYGLGTTNAIMGPYQDIDPTFQGQISWQVIDAIPCRKFVLNYYQVPYYGDPNSVSTGSCPSPLYATSQIVLYETTNVIDIIIQDKPFCLGWNQGRCIEGIQNATGTVAFAVPGRNNTIFSATNDAWRFTPNAAPSMVSLAWFDDQANYLGSGDSITVCPTVPTTYTLNAHYDNCPGATTVDVSDTVTVYPSGSLITAAGFIQNVSCYGGNNGSASVNISTGTAPYTFTWSPSGGNGQTASGLTAGNYTATISDAAGCLNTVPVTITQPPLLTANSPPTTSVSCFNGNNGVASVTAAGGTPGYTYSWAPSGGAAATASNLTAGNYTVYITDANNCTTSSAVSVTQPAVLTALGGTLANVSCFNGNNGVARVTPGGGTPGYTYSWLPSGGNGATASSLTAGTYTVIVADANGCTAISTANITQPPALTLGAPVVANVSCFNGNNGSASVNPGGGSPGYSYSWSPSGGNGITASNLTAGTYTVTVTDANSCSITTSTTVTQPLALTAIGSTITNVLCFGGNDGSVSVTPGDGTPGYSYLWSASSQTGQTATGLASGSYTVTVTDANNCTVTATATVSQPTALAALGSTINNTTCNAGSDGSVTVTPNNGTPGYSYLWTASSQTGQTATGLSAGSYTVTVTDANGCTILANATVTEPPVVTASASTLNNISCSSSSNGVATAVGGGGSGGPYSYSWSPSGGNGNTASNLSGGTYTVTVSDFNGCTQTATTTINQTNPILASIPATTNVSCFSGSDGQAIASASGGTGPYTYSWAPSGGSAVTAANLTASAYTVLVTDANGCTEVAYTQITEPPVLTSNIPASTDALCNASSDGAAYVTVIGGTGTYTYSWLPSGGSSATASNLAAGTYTVNVTDQNNCISTSTVIINEPALLVSALNGTTDVSCYGGNNGSASVNVVGGTATYTYSWLPSGGNSAAANNLTAGTYTVAVADANGCLTATMVNITEPPLLTSNISSQTDVLCNGGNTGSATVAFNGGQGIPTYSWSTVPVQTNATAIDFTAGTYTVTVTDANGCTTSSSVTIIEPPILISNISAQTNILCFGGNNGSATVAVNGGSGGPLYSWNTVPVQTGAIASNLIAGSYVVTVTDGNGCTTTSSVTITEPPLLTSNIPIQTDILCFGGNNGSATVVVNGGEGIPTYLWNTTPVQTSATATNLTSGNYTVTVTDGNGCTTSASVTITEPSILAAVINSSSNVSCNGGSNGSASVVVNGGAVPYAYQWSPSGEITNTANSLVAGNYTVTITDANACSVVQNVTITEPSAVTLAINGAATICQNQSATVTAVPAGGIQPYTYSWDNGPTSSSQTLSPSSTSNYSVIVTDANGCTISQSVTITVYPPLNVAATSTSQLCIGSVGMVSSTAGGGNGGPYTYAWSTGQTSPSFTVTGLSSSTYTVTINDGCSPPVQAITSIVVNPIPVVNFTPDSIAQCVPVAVNFTSDTVSSIPGSTYFWNLGDGTTSTDANPSHVYPDAGQYSVTLTITTPAGCSNTLPVINLVTAHAIPTASFIAPLEVPIEGTASIDFINTSSGSNSWLWNFGDNTGSSTDFNVSHIYSDTGTYTVQLIAESLEGCIDTTYRIVWVRGEFAIFIPNSFTPNGDGKNDGFNAFGIYLRDYDMWILDRWGGKIYHSTSINNPWDGTYFENNSLCQNGVYIYKIKVHDLKGKLHEFVGAVSLVR